MLRDRLRQLNEQRGKTTLSVCSNPSHSVSIQDFELVKPISKGAYGRVFLARKKNTGDLYAIKVMNNENSIERIKVNIFKLNVESWLMLIVLLL